jgi:hypothetical protein
MSDIQLRLEVWRPARLNRRLMYENQDDRSLGIGQLQDDRLHEQVYSWKLRGDVWTSLGGDDAGSHIQKAITAGFDFSLRPEERSIKKLKSVVDELIGYLADDEHRQWQSWEQPVVDDDPDNTYQIQPLLSLHHHLKWLCEVFQDIPGASVTIR